MPAMHYLVDHLGELSGSGRTSPLGQPGIDRHHRLGAGIILLAAAADAQLAIDRARLAAGNRGVDETEAAFPRLLRQFARDAADAVV